MTNETPNIDQFVGKLNTALDVLTEQVIKIAPEAAELVVGLVQFKGAFSIVVALFLILFYAVFCQTVVRRLWAWCDKSGDRGMYALPAMLVTVLGIVVVSIAATILLNFYNWLSLLYPEAALAYKALEATGISL